MARKKADEIDFESSLNELNAIVEKMEQGGISLEESLQQFERGIHLTRHCQKALQTAEQKVAILMEKNGKVELEPYKNDDELDD